MTFKPRKRWLKPEGKCLLCSIKVSWSCHCMTIRMESSRKVATIKSLDMAGMYGFRGWPTLSRTSSTFLLSSSTCSLTPDMISFFASIYKRKEREKKRNCARLEHFFVYNGGPKGRTSLPPFFESPSQYHPMILYHTRTGCSFLSIKQDAPLKINAVSFTCWVMSWGTRPRNKLREKSLMMAWESLNLFENLCMKTTTLIWSCNLKNSQCLTSGPALTTTQSNPLCNTANFYTDHILVFLISKIAHALGLFDPGVPDN